MFVPFDDILNPDAMTRDARLAAARARRGFNEVDG
jgi:hypothetical protein